MTQPTILTSPTLPPLLLHPHFTDSGIGLESSVLFASEGAQVVCADINEKGAAATVEKITSLFGPGRAVSIRADVSKEEDVKKMMRLAVSEFGKVYVFSQGKRKKQEGGERKDGW